MAASDLYDERAEELSSIVAIFPELRIDPDQPYAASLTLPVKVATPITVKFQDDHEGDAVADVQIVQEQGPNDGDLQSYSLTFLPPLDIDINLPEGYPELSPPQVHLKASTSWLPATTLDRLASHVSVLWEEYGGGQIIYSYIDYLQQASETAFASSDQNEQLVVIASTLKAELLKFDRLAKKEEFERGTYDCGVCLEPKKGSQCHQMFRCEHVFCIACLQDVYNNAITEGDIAAIRCLDPVCGSKKNPASKRVIKSTKTLGPGELLEIPIERPTVERYVNLKRKKKLEADKTTIYCPRQWCQGPARSKRYPKSNDLSQMDSYPSDNEDDTPTAPGTTTTQQPARSDKEINEGRLAICEDCDYAFCRTCLSGWHGEFVRCWPRTTTELSAEEKQSYDWIRMNTSPCPTCSTPTQKTMGCNHMQCKQCRTHFCYLCSAWLEPADPYKHFNRPGYGCYQRLWELEDGDDGGNANLAFGGPRGWEAEMEAQDEAEAQAQAQAQAQADAEADAANAALLGAVNGDAPHMAALDDQALRGLAGLHLDDPPGDHQNGEGARGEENGEQQGRDQQQRARAMARNVPERLQIGRRAHPGLRGVRREPQNEGLQRFLQMAVADNEDEWDSDELDDDGDDADWEIPER